jgi:hypothetical protein
MKLGKWIWTFRTPAGVIETGEVAAVDPRDALSGALTSSKGMQLAAQHRICTDVLLNAPGNDERVYRVNYQGCDIQVERIDTAAAGCGRSSAEGALWHYTVGHKLPPIRNTGALLPTGVRIAPSEAPVLWFSADPVYEPTAIKLVQMPSQHGLHRPTMSELHELIGVFRFRLASDDERLVPWSRLQRRARISPTGVASMLRAGIEIGAKPTNWFGVMSPVALDDLVFQSWDGHSWGNANLDDEIHAIEAKLQLVQSRSAGAFSPQGIRNAWQAGTGAAG